MMAKKRIELGPMQGDFEKVLFAMSEVLDSIYKGFIHRKRAFREEAAGKMATLGKAMRVLKGKMDNPEDVQQSLFEDLEGICRNIAEIQLRVQERASEGILFSEKAVLELTELICGAHELFHEMRDLIVTENQILANYIQQRVSELKEKARNYETEHEERLIKGICISRGSFYYLAMTSSIKDMLSNIKTFAGVYRKQ